MMQSQSMAIRRAPVQAETECGAAACDRFAYGQGLPAATPSSCHTVHSPAAQSALLQYVTPAPQYAMTSYGPPVRHALSVVRSGQVTASADGRQARKPASQSTHQQHSPPASSEVAPAPQYAMPSYGPPVRHALSVVRSGQVTASADGRQARKPAPQSARLQ